MCYYHQRSPLIQMYLLRTRKAEYTGTWNSQMATWRALGSYGAGVVEQRYDLVIFKMRKEGYLCIKTSLCLALEFSKDHIVTGGLIRYQNYFERSHNSVWRTEKEKRKMRRNGQRSETSSSLSIEMIIYSFHCFHDIS